MKIIKYRIMMNILKVEDYIDDDKNEEWIIDI